MIDAQDRYVAPFNGAVEIGLRAIALLTEAFPAEYSLQRLVVFDYLLVHSDDVPQGPSGLHPKTPHRSGELLVRRDNLQRGLLLLLSRGLVQRSFRSTGVTYTASSRASAFLDVLESDYVRDLRERAEWIVEHFTALSDDALQDFVTSHLGQWGAEFELESVLWMEEGE